MTGRGIDQIMPSPCDPTLYESYIRSALDYVALAEQASGKIAKPVPFDYIWGDALAEIKRREPDRRIINLETSITGGGIREAKGINYRMHPENIRCISAALIDCCVLANNHVADWGPSSAKNTLEALRRIGVATAGAGRNAAEAVRPAVLQAPGGTRLLVFAFAHPSSGVPAGWAAGPDRSGVNFLDDLSKRSIARIAGDVGRWAASDDLVMVSIHWGLNWGHEISAEHRRFAHALINEAGVHVIHGHSSHHPKAVEIHAGRPIFYGCGDFINDYEGIRGYEEFRPNLVLAYFLDLHDREHVLQRLEMVPFQLRKFRLSRASLVDAAWLQNNLDKQCRPFGHGVRLIEEGTLKLSWRHERR